MTTNRAGVTWDQFAVNWNDTIALNWTEVAVVTSVSQALDGKVRRRDVKKVVDKMPKETKDRLIKIFVKLNGMDEVEQEKAVRDQIRLSVKDIEFVIKEGIKVDLKLL